MQSTDARVREAQLLAALTARLRLAELDGAGDPATVAQLDRVADALGVREQHDQLEPHERAVLVSFARTYLRQAVDLIEDPARAGAWTHSDPAILQAQGRASGLVASLIARAGLGRRDARILDVGTGVAGLAIALCIEFADSTVVGVDPWEPALTLARGNVADAGLDARITLVPSTIEGLEDPEGFDLVWFPSFFIPDAAIDDALKKIRTLTRPGADVVVGVFEAPDDPVAAAVDSLFTIRSGGAVLTVADAVDRLAEAGFVEAHEVERTWNAPILFVAARTP